MHVVILSLKKPEQVKKTPKTYKKSEKKWKRFFSSSSSSSLRHATAYT